MTTKNPKAWFWIWLLCPAVAVGPALAAGVCDEDASWARSETQRHFVVLTARKDVFHDGGGPTAVSVIKLDAAAAELETGAVGLYANDDGRRTFGAVPPRVYDELVRDARDPTEVMLRLEVTGAQYGRVLDVLQTWDRRARENVLLYPDLAMNTILFVKQAAEAINRCDEVIDLYVLDWGIGDKISDDNYPGVVPFLFFEELKRRNAALHVPDDEAPVGVLLAAGPAPDARRDRR